jgi:hypothetical protein
MNQSRMIAVRNFRYGSSMSLRSVRIVLLVTSAALAACTNANEAALKIGRPSEKAAQIREAETRRWSGSEAVILSEATQVLQDLGYTIAESSTEAGLLAGNKERDAQEAGQVAGAILVAVLLGASAARWDMNQILRVTITTWPERQTAPVATPGNRQRGSIRVSFERLVRNNRGEVRHESMTDAALLAEFYAKLRQSLPAEAELL